MEPPGVDGLRIGQNGILREPFALIPITYALIAVSGVSAAVGLAGRKG